MFVYVFVYMFVYMFVIEFFHSNRSLSSLRASASRYISSLEELNKVKLSRFRLEK